PAHQSRGLVLPETWVGQPELGEPAHLAFEAGGARGWTEQPPRVQRGSGCMDPLSLEARQRVLQYPVEQGARPVSLGAERVDPHYGAALDDDPARAGVDELDADPVDPLRAGSDAGAASPSGDLLPTLGGGPVETGADQEHLGGREARGLDGPQP